MMMGGMMGNPMKKKEKKKRRKRKPKKEAPEAEPERKSIFERWATRRRLHKGKGQEVKVPIEEELEETSVKEEDRLVQSAAGSSADSAELQTEEDAMEEKALSEPKKDDDHDDDDEEDDDDDIDYPDLIPLYTPQGASVKLFCIHPSHRYGLALMPFSTGLSFQTMVSMYGVGFIDPTKIGESWDCVGDLAEEYIELIKEEQSHGPYFLCGYSFGGVVAYEMACQLTEEGQEVSFVGMIDTIPWYPKNRVNAMKLKSVIWEDYVTSQMRGQVVLQYETFMEKMCTRMMKISTEEYRKMRDELGHDGVEEEMKKKSAEQNVPLIDMNQLYQSLLHDQELSQQTHDQWIPPEVRYPGRVTYIKAQDSSLTPQIPMIGTAVESWTEVANGTLDQFTVPGNHYSISEMPLARNVGGILASTVAMAFRRIFPNLGVLPKTRLHELALRKLTTTGVKVLVYSRRDYKEPSARLLRLSSDGTTLLFFSVISTHKKPRLRKRIPIKALLVIVPSRHCPRALEDLRKCKKGAHSDIHISEMVSLVTEYRSYNLACLSDSCTSTELITAFQAIMKIPIVQ